MTVAAKVEALNLAPEIETLVYERLIPAVYLDQVAAKTTDRDQRHALHAQVARVAGTVECDCRWGVCLARTITNVMNSNSWRTSAPASFSAPVPVLKDAMDSWRFIIIRVIVSVTVSLPP